MAFLVTIHKEGQEDEVRTMDVPNRFAVYEAIEKEGGTVIALQEKTGRLTLKLPEWLHTFIEGRIKHAEVARMARDLSTMLSAGLSLSRSLLVIERETENKHLKGVATNLAAVVEKGSPFHVALSERPSIFPDILVAMVRVGEESGSLAESLATVALQMEHANELTRKVKGALIYPCIIIVAIIIVSVLMMIYVVPSLTQTFKDLKVELPAATKVFVAISDFMVNHIFLVIGGIIALAFLLVWIIRSKWGSALIIRGSLKLPVIGELVRETFAARTARTLSSLLTAGVPVLEALAITKDVVKSHSFTVVIEDAEARVKKGEALSAAFTAHAHVYPVLMSEMLIVGEETGKVAGMLKQAAEFYEEDVNQKTRDLSTIIEPVLMLLIGGVVGVFAVSMIAPIYSLSSAF
jgi:type IV pilus assembly protein PilC